MVGDGRLTCGSIVGEARGLKVLVSLHRIWKKEQGYTCGQMGNGLFLRQAQDGCFLSEDSISASSSLFMRFCGVNWLFGWSSSNRKW
jgi:hypothetical protein